MIDSFKGKYRFLSNFYPCWIRFEGDIYPSVEHAYQAAKTLHRMSRLPFMESAMTPGEAKKAGRRLKIRPDWEEIKVEIMKQCLLDKFTRGTFMNKLMETEGHELVEGNTWGDTFWGVCNGEGENWLGRLLMEIRDGKVPVESGRN